MQWQANMIAVRQHLLLVEDVVTAVPIVVMMAAAAAPEQRRTTSSVKGQCGASAECAMIGEVWDQMQAPLGRVFGIKSCSPASRARDDEVNHRSQEMVR